MGTGTNAWGREPVNIVNGLDFVGGIGLNGGNWIDFPAASIGQNTTFLQEWGPTASSISNLAPQPQFKLIQGNPYVGTAQFSVSVAMTNSKYRTLLGTNLNGVSLYLETFGFSLYNNSDSVKSGINNNENQQPATWGLLSGDTLQDFYLDASNASRPLDSVSGQVGQCIPLWTNSSPARCSGGVSYSTGKCLDEDCKRSGRTEESSMRRRHYVRLLSITAP